MNLPLLPGPLKPRVVLHVSALSMFEGQRNHGMLGGWRNHGMHHGGFEVRWINPKVSHLMIRCYHSEPEWTWEQLQWRGTPHSLKLQHYLSLELFSIICRILIKWVLLLCRDAVSVFSWRSHLWPWENNRDSKLWRISFVKKSKSCLLKWQPD